ncbi:MAG TPA: leishmanolysin-related zinc metalloendopeptidase, partial [Gemmatimonadales bacterium]|nr:leishmanolysin-related zinc metalloendopeptidase [Gemmatimonadales bacterium]
QSATVGTAVPAPLKVRLADSSFAGVAGAIVTFVVSQGGGTTVAADTTDTSGTASTSWQLGTKSGLDTVTATISGGTFAPVRFTATGHAGPPVVMTVQAGDSETAHAGTAVAVAPAVQLQDAFNNPVPGVVVSFGVTAGSGLVVTPTVTTDANGSASDSWTLGTAGTNTLHASLSQSGVTGNPHDFTATGLAAGTPTQALVASGDSQTGLIGYALNFQPALQVLDSANGPVPGVAVTFAVTGGGGSVTGASTTTNLFGIATLGSWTVLAGANTLSGTATGGGISGNPVSFSATGVPSTFNISLRYLSAVSASRQAVFDSAAAKWQRLIIGDIPDLAVNIPSGQCGPNAPAINETIDDVIIFVTLDSIDGPGKILGQSGPCFIRLPGSLPLVGIMHFDTADVAFLENNNAFNSVILHEMGHVLGYGTIWSGSLGLNLLAGPARQGGTDPHFIGVQAVAQFNASGGAGYSAGAKVPVESCIGVANCGPGTIDSHWRESVLVNELMTGFLSVGSNPLSVISTASMGDEGYVVNYAGSDPYTVANPLAALRMAGGVRIEMRDDVIHLPIYLVNTAGRVVGTIAPIR